MSQCRELHYMNNAGMTPKPFSSKEEGKRGKEGGKSCKNQGHTCPTKRFG